MRVGREGFASEWGGVQFGENQAVRGIGQTLVIARLVLPRLKMGCLGGPNAQEDTQNFCVGDSLGERRIEAGAALLNGGEGKAGGVGDGLKVVLGGPIPLRSGGLRK